jgi:hypothetical protein
MKNNSGRILSKTWPTVNFPLSIEASDLNVDVTIERNYFSNYIIDIED